MTDEPYLVTTKRHMHAVMELHELCFNSDEQPKIGYALLDKNCFALLGGCDEDGQPTGYAVVRVQGKEAEGLWIGVRADRWNLKRNRSRKRRLGHTLFLAGINEARARGAEYINTYVLSDLRTSAITLRMHKEMGYVLVDYFSDYYTLDGKRIECTNHHFRKSLKEIDNE